MTRTGGKEASVSSRGIGKDERQPVMARLASDVAQWRHSNLVKLVTLRKGNHPARGRRKALCRTERDSLEGPHEEAEIQRKALRRGKIFAFSEDTCLVKERVRLKVTPRKVGVGLKRRREPSRRRLGWRLG